MRFPHLTLLGVLVQASGTTARGTQSGPNAGPLYAGGMVYDADNEEIYLTGISYSGFDQSMGSLSLPNCFVGAIDLNSWNWDNMFSIGTQDVLESCQTMVGLDQFKIMVLGNSEYGGLYADSSMKMSGFAMTLDKGNLNNPLGGLSLLTSSTEKIPYPVMGVAQDNDVYIISLTSTDSQLSAAGQKAANSQFPNWISDQKYGSSLDMSVRKLSSKQQEFLGIPDGDMTFDTTWRQEFPMDLEQDLNAVPPRVYIGGLLIKNHEFLIVTGSTRGLGTAYGPASGDDEDGFITILSMETGELANGRKNNERIGSSEDDVISGICDDPTDPYSFYVVGATKGDMGGRTPGQLDIPQGSLQGWVRKMNADDLSTRWTVQWGAQLQGNPTIAYAQGCFVQGDVVYVTGVVEGGANMVNGNQVLQSQGGADIWVAQLDGGTGNVNWMKQVGSQGDDRIARNGGVTADVAGNAIIYGDTTGSLYRDRSSDEVYSDVFVMYLEADDGSFAQYGQPVAPPTDPPSMPVAAPTFFQPPTQTEFNPVGIQLPGPRYAGGVVYDSGSDIALITGAAYQENSMTSDCFVATVDLYSGQLMSSSFFGESSTPEACSAIDYSLSEDLAYVVGGTVVGGYLTDRMLPYEVNVETVQYGLVFQVTDQGFVQGAAINQEEVVQYPVAVVADPVQDYVYVAFMGSAYSDENQIFDQYPNLMGQGTPAYGSTWFTAVQRYAVTSTNGGGDVAAVLNEDWYNLFGADQEVFTSGMTLAGNGDTLVVVGSTRGSGGEFGEKSGSDMDGFIIKLDPNTGDVVSNVEELASTRLDSSNQRDDWVTNVCNDRFDNDAIYVVGASMGAVRELPDDQQPPDGTTHSFVAKVNLRSLTAEWLKHFTMRPGSSDVLASSRAYGCTVTFGGEGNLVYVAGVVESGAVLDGADVSSSYGMDDIYVAQLNGFDGSVNWVKQVGTSQNDRLAKGGGIDVDSQGNAIVLGETYGGLFSAKSQSASNTPDVFMFTMSRIDGSYKAPDPNASPPDQPDPMEPGTDDFADGSGAQLNNIVALQSGPDVGPSFAGGMSYDRFTNAVYVTGATYGAFASPGVAASMESSCFFGAVSLPQLLWVDRGVYGTSDIPEACNGVSMTQYDGNSAAIVVGSTEANGLLTQLGEGTTRKQYGIAMDLANVDGHYTLVGGALMDEYEVQYPIAVESFGGGAVFIVSMASRDSVVTPDYQQVMNKEFPNYTLGGVVKYGSVYAISIEKHTMVRTSGSYDDGVIENSLTLDWRKPFETTDNEAVYVTGVIMVLAGEALVVVGSTRAADDAKNMDGLMAKISPESGSFVSDPNGGRSVAYFSSSDDRDDWVFGTCPDPDDGSVFYVVGATQGKLGDNIMRAPDDVTVHAIISKVDANTLDPIWIKQISSTHADGTDTKPAAAAAISCDVIPGQNLMYVAGNVENGATIDYQDESTIKSAGNDDIFVAQLDTQSGEIRWLKQVGSNGNDRIARGGGVKADQSGNAIVFGDTDGSFYRDRNADAFPRFSDVFLMVFELENGYYLPPLVGYPLQDDSPSGDTSAPKEFYPNSSSSSKASSSKTATIVIVIIVVLLVVILFVIYICRRQTKKTLDTQESSGFVTTAPQQPSYHDDLGSRTLEESSVTESLPFTYDREKFSREIS